MYPWATPWKNPQSPFTILFKMYPLWNWATHEEFFQNVLRDLLKTYPVGSFKTFQKKLSIWLNFTTNSQRTHWVNGWVQYGQIAGYFVKEVMVSGSGTWWAHFDQIIKEPTGYFQTRAHRVLWWVLLKLTHHLPSDPIKIKVVGTLRIYPPFTHRVKCE